MLQVVPETRRAPAFQFTQSSYQFVVRADAQVGDPIGRVQVALPADSRSAVIYFLRPRNDFFDVNETTGVIYVIRDLTQWSARRRRRRQRDATQRRPRRSVVAVELHVVAQTGQFEAEVTVQLAINRTLCCGPPTTTRSPNADSGLAGTPLILLIVLLSLAIIIAGIVVIVCLRRRHTKSSLGGATAGHGAESTAAESSSLETFDAPLPPPPAYGDDPMRRRRFQPTCPTLPANEYDDEYESSGRGSTDKPGQCDHEIQMINCIGGGGSGRGACPAARGGVVQPDSGIQPDHDDAGSTTGSAGPRPRGRGLAAATSVDSMHQFYDEGGGEASVGMSEDLTLSSPCYDQPVIDADQLLLIAGNSRYGAADYLLNWKPEYQPLADVFAEIARLPDDSKAPHADHPRRRPPPVAKTCPTHIVPQPPAAAVNHRLGSAPAGARPPPIITSAPPRAVRVAMATDNDSVTSSLRSSASSNHVQPPSAWAYQQPQQQQPMSFSRHQSRDHERTCSVPSQHNSPGHSQPMSSSSSTRSRASDREIHI